MNCNLDYIPNHLHTENKPIVDEFLVGEKLFYRCLPQNIEKPYDKISLKDISHNRNFCDDEIFGSNNVFYNVIENDLREKYEGYNYITIVISNIKEMKTYCKKISNVNHLDETIIITITLKHSPISCMYPHSIFEIMLGSEIVNDENYETTIGRDNKFFSRLRNEIRQELTSIIQTKKIDLSNDIEIINQP